MQVSFRTFSSCLAGRSLNCRQQNVRPQARLSVRVTAEEERLRLNNLSPQKGSRKKETRKGRGHAAGQGASCGFGMRGQKSRSGSGTRPGFEGGQMPLYRRLPKLKGIAGGMPAGISRYVTINLDDLTKFGEGEEVTLDALQEKRILNLSGREAKLPLKVLGNGKLPARLTIHAAAFSEGAKQKIETAGGQTVVVPQKPVWTRKLHAERLAAAGGTDTKQKQGKQ